MIAVFLPGKDYNESTRCSARQCVYREPVVMIGKERFQPLIDRMNMVPGNSLEAFQIAAAAGMVGDLSNQLATLQNHGLLVVESSPADLSGRLISQYLEIKARHLL